MSNLNEFFSKKKNGTGPRSLNRKTSMNKYVYDKKKAKEKKIGFIKTVIAIWNSNKYRICEKSTRNNDFFPKLLNLFTRIYAGIE